MAGTKAKDGMRMNEVEIISKGFRYGGIAAGVCGAIITKSLVPLVVIPIGFTGEAVVESMGKPKEPKKPDLLDPDWRTK